MRGVGEALTDNVTDTALIFEGGGMRGAFTSGVVTTLLDAGIHTSWVGGISAGTTCLANYVSRDAERAQRSFVEFAAEPEFGDWRTWLKGKGVFNAEWIYEHTGGPDQALPFDFDTFSADPAQVRIGAFRCADGQIVYWGREDVAALPSLMKRVRASSTMPALMPITTIDGVDYCDGALGPTGGFALDAALADGYERFVVVMTRERGYRKPRPRLPAAYRQIFRRYPAIAKALLDRPDNYNRTLDDLLDLERQGRAFLIFPDEMPIKNSERNLTRLRAVFDAGRAQSQRQLPDLLSFLRLA